MPALGNEKIRICHVVNNITGKSDGVYAHLKMLFKSLDKNKYQQYLIFQGNPIIEEEVKKLGVIVYSLPSLKKKCTINTFIVLYRFLKENKISIIHAHLVKPYVLVGIINVFLRKRAIFNYHGSFIRNEEYYTLLEEIIYRVAHIVIFLCHSVHRVVVPSKASKNILLSETRLFPAVEVYYNGCADRNEITPNSGTVKTIDFANIKKYKVGIISRFAPEKRVDIAIHIAQNLLLIRNDFCFYIYGDGALEKSLQQLINDLKLSQTVSLVGFVPNVNKYIGEFDIVLLTSDREGMPFLVWETMASGVPIVATDVGGIREIVELENCGRVYERRNVQQAVTLLNELLDNNLLRERMGENGKKAIAEKYNEKEFSKRFDEIYDSVFHS